MKKNELLDCINWRAVLAAPRYAGGHEEVMTAIFYSWANVLAHYTEDGYSGEIAIAYQFADGGVVVLTDYFGSCSGCDAWEDASAEEVRNMVTSMVTSARVFDTIEQAREWCKAAKSAEDYPFDAARHLSF